jgi:hypothetical protein
LGKDHFRAADCNFRWVRLDSNGLDGHAVRDNGIALLSILARSSSTRKQDRRTNLGARRTEQLASIEEHADARGECTLVVRDEVNTFATELLLPRPTMALASPTSRRKLRGADFVTNASFTAMT